MIARTAGPDDAGVLVRSGRRHRPVAGDHLRERGVGVPGRPRQLAAANHRDRPALPGHRLRPAAVHRGQAGVALS